MNRSDAPFSWVVLNQSQSPAFQDMMGRLADRFGRCLLFTGMPHPSNHANLVVEQAPAYSRRGIASRAASWSRFGAAAAARVAGLPGRPFIFATTNPPFLPHLLWALHKARGFRYGVLIWDIYPEHVLRRGWLRPSSTPTRAWFAANRLALRGAETVITLGDRMAEVIVAQMGGGRVEVVPNWADTSAIVPVAKRDNRTAQRRGVEEKVSVLYAGNMGASHGLESVVAAAGLLASDPRIVFTFVGDGLGRAALQEQVRAQHLNNVQTEPMLPWAEVPMSLAAGDVAIVAQEPGTEDLSMPSKTYSALAAGSALLSLTKPNSDLARLTDELAVGTVCDRDEPRAIAAAIQRFADDPGWLKTCRENARRAAVERFSADAVFERFATVLGPHLPRSG